MKTVAVFGSSRRDESSPFWSEAYTLGRLLATAGYAVISGGYGGSMGAVSKGAAECGGKVTGVTCSLFDPARCNEWLTEEVKTPTLIARLTTMIERADAFVAVRGGIGTLSEITLVWSLLQTGTLRDAPLILLGADWRAVVHSWRAAHGPRLCGRSVGRRRRQTGASPPRAGRAPNTSRPSACRVTGPRQEGDSGSFPVV